MGGKRAAQKNSGRNATPASKRAKAEPSSSAKSGGETPSKVDERRRLDRRDTDERVDRIIARKLAGRFPHELIEGATAADGITVRETIAAEVRLRRGSNEYLRQEFWVQFFAKFKFHEGVSGFLPEPSSKAEVRPEATWERVQISLGVVFG